MSFELLHPRLQRRLYEMEWKYLRPIQDDTIAHLAGGGGDFIVSAPTASGKTEAAFLPILSKIADDFSGGVRALYIGPLKALINDQFGRLEDLCVRMEVPVHKWHGDVGDGARRALLRSPSGVLLITPESLEAMFILRPTQIPAIFGRLQFVVVDELHAFIGSVRGAQLQSQLHRLKLRAGADPIRVGLSATLGDDLAAGRWLRPNGEPAKVISDATASREIAVRVRGVWKRPPLPDDEDDPTREDALRTVARGILRACHSKTNLAFANAKGEIESIADMLAEETSSLGIRHDVVVHHGSLSQEQRESTEARLRLEAPCTAVCSNTLEMGIDIGSIDCVIQLAAPWSVASLAQRVGRSGRREGDVAILRAFFVEEELSSDSTFWDGLHLGFVRGVATTELMLAKFTEPPDVSRHHLSTLVQQVLSTLAETGGVHAANLHERLTACGAFAPLSPRDFGEILRTLAGFDLVEQMPQGDLVLGVKGQRLCEHYSFYAAFKTPEEFRVLHGTTAIGTLPSDLIPPVGDHVILAGRRWRVDQLDADRRELYVVPARGRRPPKFPGAAMDVHPRVHERMCDLLTSSDVPEYLDASARDMLAQARDVAVRSDLARPRGLEVGERTRLLLFAGTRAQRTLHLVLREAKLAVEAREVGLDVEARADHVADILARFVDSSTDGVELAIRADAELGARATGDKYDSFLPPRLWAKAYVAERLDMVSARRVARELVGAGEVPRLIGPG